MSILTEDNFNFINDLILNNTKGKLDKLQFTNNLNILTIDAEPTENYEINLPPSKGINGQVLDYDGENTFSWTTPSVTGPSFVTINSNTSITESQSSTTFKLLPGPYDVTLPTITQDGIYYTFYSDENLGSDVNINSDGSDNIRGNSFNLIDATGISGSLTNIQNITIVSDNTNSQWIILDNSPDWGPVGGGGK